MKLKPLFDPTYYAEERARAIAEELASGELGGWKYVADWDSVGWYVKVYDECGEFVGYWGCWEWLGQD